MEGVLNSQLYDNMVQSNRAYKNEIKNIELHEKEKNNTYFETLLENKDIRFWREWRKIKARSSNYNNSSSSDSKMAYRLVNEFSKKFIDSRNDKILLNEFLKKYKKSALILIKRIKINRRSLLSVKLKELQKVLNQKEQETKMVWKLNA